jgi:hypothetical protein
MKSLARWSATLGLIGSAVLGTGFLNPQKIFALPQAEVIQVLQPIPVYTIADEKGAPLVAVDKDNKKSTFIFVSKDEAQQFYQRLTTEKPDIAKKVKVQVVSLAEIYKVASDNAKKPDGLNFSFVPIPEEIDSAKKILGASGQQYQGGVPLFVARGGPEKGYLTIQQNNQQFVPFFFEQSQLQQMIDQLKKDKPDLASTIKVEVIPLEAIMTTLEEKNDEFLKRIVLWPSIEMKKVIESTIQQQQTAQPKK